MKKNENIPLVIGILIPILMIVFVAVSIYLPTIFVHPKGSFLYAVGGDYYSNVYSAQNGKLIKNEAKYPPNFSGVKTEPKLYVYNIEKDAAREISFEEAQKIDLNPSSVSPDGFEITSGSNDYSIFSIFFSRGDHYGSKYVQGRGISKRLNLTNEDNRWYYYHNFHFIGWIKE